MIRAGKADTPEASRYTSVYERIMQLKRLRQTMESAAPADSDANPIAPGAATAEGDLWLSPIQLADRFTSAAGSANEDSPETMNACNPFPSRRLTNEGFLPMTLEHYLCLLDWTGRQIRSDKHGSIPAELATILERLRIKQESWPDLVSGFAKRFHSAVGRVDSMAQYARRLGRRWVAGIRESAVVFT